MAQFVSSVKTFLETEDGPTAVEYAVMLALILVACIATVQTLGESANDKFVEIEGYLSDGGTGGTTT